MDIFSECRIFAKPTKENIDDLCHKAAHISLLRYPSSMQAVVDGMGAFWKKVTEDMLVSLYSSTVPTAEGVIGALYVTENNVQDSKITTYLHRYIRACSDNELQAFLRFISGSTVLVPGDKIKVNYVHQSGDYIFPSVKTCFRILNLPGCYTSFAHFRQNLQKYIGDEKLWAIEDNSVLTLDGL